MSKTIEKRSDYQQARGSTQQHDVNIFKFLSDGESISSATATHIPRNTDGVAEGDAGDADVGTITDGIIPIMLTIPSDNPIGIHILEVKPVCSMPNELPIFRVLIDVPF